MATTAVDLGEPIPRNVRTPTISTGTFPSSHTTMTATRDRNIACSCDATYLRTIPGIVKLLQISFNVVGFICILASGQSSASRAVFFCFVSGFGFGNSEIFLLLHLFQVPQKLPTVPWLAVELICCCVWSILYLIAASLVAAVHFIPAFGVAAFFGFAAMVAYGYNAYVIFCEFYLNKAARNQPNANVENQPSNVVG